MDSEKNIHELLLKELQEQTKWIRFLALPKLKKLAEENVKTSEQKRTYELSDGSNSTQGIAKALNAENIKISH